jgi:hypothetical protein
VCADRAADTGTIAVDQVEDAGTPASSRISAKIIASNGAISLGFNTMVQPAARAGATLTAIWFIGQFHGVIMPQTPIGSLTTSVVPMRSSNR